MLASDVVIDGVAAYIFIAILLLVGGGVGYILGRRR